MARGTVLRQWKIGANIFGGAAQEQILLNHSDLVWQGRISVVPDVSVKISQVRKLIDEGEYEQAREVMQKALIQKNFRPQPHTPLPLCVLKTKMTSDNAPKNYVRELNMATGEATVSYSDGSTRIDRALFVSRHDDTVVYEITKQAAGLSIASCPSTLWTKSTAARPTRFPRCRKASPPDMNGSL